MKENTPPSGSQLPYQATASPKRPAGKVIDAILIVKGKNPQVESLRAELAGEKARTDKAVLAFGDEAVAHRYTHGLLDNERALTRILGERLDEEKAANRRLGGLLKLRSDFVAQMVHQLKNPLSVILGGAQMLKDAWASQQAKEVPGLIERAGLRMKETVSMMLDFSQAESGKLKVCHEKVELGAEMESAVRFMQTLARDRKVTLALENPSPVYAELDRRLLQHVMVNLISNGIKYGKAGGNGLVTISVEKKGDRASISVSDSGIGIDNKDIPRLFEPFSRLDNAETIEGTGLGLVVVKKFTELMDGTISVESEMGKGSVFMLSFPVAEKETA
jgi:signal transduction histidine kinase